MLCCSVSKQTERTISMKLGKLGVAWAKEGDRSADLQISCLPTLQYSVNFWQRPAIPAVLTLGDISRHIKRFG